MRIAYVISFLLGIAAGTLAWSGAADARAGGDVGRSCRWCGYSTCEYTSFGGSNCCYVCAFGQCDCEACGECDLTKVPIVDIPPEAS